jgi:hypothetical protein
MQREAQEIHIFPFTTEAMHLEKILFFFQKTAPES